MDLVARRLPDGSLVTAEPLPAPLVEARDHVARDFGVGVNWLNPGPTGLLELGLPEGFADRMQPSTSAPRSPFTTPLALTGAFRWMGANS